VEWEPGLPFLLSRVKFGVQQLLDFGHILELHLFIGSSADIGTPQSSLNMNNCSLQCRNKLCTKELVKAWPDQVNYHPNLTQSSNAIAVVVACSTQDCLA
jgi:hypothetical protein